MIVEALLAVLILIESILFAFTNNVQKTTLYVGKILANDNELAPKNGFQDAITPKTQNIRNWISFSLFIVIVCISFTITWLLIPLSIIAVFTLSIIITRLFLPKDLAFYVRLLFANLAKRSANYMKSGDIVRADAAKDIGFDVEKVLEDVTKTKVSIFDID